MATVTATETAAETETKTEDGHKDVSVDATNDGLPTPSAALACAAGDSNACVASTFVYSGPTAITTPNWNGHPVVARH